MHEFLKLQWHAFNKKHVTYIFILPGGSKRRGDVSIYDSTSIGSRWPLEASECNLLKMSRHRFFCCPDPTAEFLGATKSKLKESERT